MERMVLSLHRDSKIRGVKGLFFACVCAFCLGTAFGQSSHQNDLKDLREDVSTLKKDVNTLGQELQQVINRLDELTRVPSPGSGTNVAAPVPTKTNIHGLAFKGSSTAAVVVIEYADFECPFCIKFNEEVYPQILENYIETGKLKYLYRDFPLQMHSHATWAARAVRCAGEQGKSWEMRACLFANQTNFSEKTTFDHARAAGIEAARLTECLSSERFIDEIRKDVSQGEGMGVDRTPTFLLGIVDSNGDDVKISNVIRGVYPFQTFKAVLDELLVSDSQEHVSTH